MQIISQDRRTELKGDFILCLVVHLPPWRLNSWAFISRSAAVCVCVIVVCCIEMNLLILDFCRISFISVSTFNVFEFLSLQGEKFDMSL